MSPRKTPAVLRRTQPELLADDERSRRARRRGTGVGLLIAGVVGAVVAAGWMFLEGVGPGAAFALTFGMATAAAGVWALRDPPDG